MIFQKTLMSLPIYCLIFSSFSFINVNGNCSSDVEDIYDKSGFNQLVASYLEAYGRDCGPLNTCEATKYEETLVALNNLIEDSGGPQDSLSLTTVPTQSELEELAKDLEDKTDVEKFSELILENPPPLSIKATADFSAYTEDETYVAYATACEEEGATMTFVDVLFVAKGDNAFETYTSLADLEEGLTIDVDTVLYSVPVCLAESCKDEKDLSDVVDKILLSQLLQVDVDEVSETVGVSAGSIDTTNLIEQFASFEAFCRLGETDGLDQCVFQVFREGEKVFIRDGDKVRVKSANGSPATTIKGITMFSVITLLASIHAVMV